MNTNVKQNTLNETLVYLKRLKNLIKNNIITIEKAYKNDLLLMDDIYHEINLINNIVIDKLMADD